jgi:hypothetical protein
MEEPMVNQQERADAYYRNIVAMIWSTRCDHAAAVRDHGRDSREAATVGNRLRSLLATVESVEAGDYHCNCEACGKPLLDGQFAIYYDDAGEVHADCSDPSRAYEDLEGVHAYDSGFTPAQCAAELEKAKAALGL